MNLLEMLYRMSEPAGSWAEQPGRRGTEYAVIEFVVV